jgi:predicted RNA-binding Zn-ribbon protein involved in translation (DUF1610 family)
METIDQAELHARMKAQFVERDDIAFVCPMCGTVQSMRTLRCAGVADDQLERYIGFSCVGRFTGKGSPPAKAADRDFQGCNWTLGGLLRLHELEVRLPGNDRPQATFAIASPEAAQALAARGGRLAEVAHG